MKLHRIRVENLNSLYGEQTLDLDADLAGASLFLIQGPTGSGKSTLMDAVSLALFGTTPRLSAVRSERDVAEQVMSRGTGNTLAELEFSKWSAGEGRVRFRASWLARRARSKPDGKMQDTERSVERQRSDGSWALLVSSKKLKDYGPVFAQLLEGFTPADFQRSMLLAQGQFDAMLHAKPEERAAILERLTDTGDYQRLGERAARMRGAWMGRLERRRAQRDAIAPLTGEALAEARTELETSSGVLEALDGRRQTLQDAVGWWRQQEVLHEALEGARGAVEALGVRQAASAAGQEALARHEACAEAFLAHDRVTELGVALATSRQALQALDARLPELLAAVEARQQGLSRAQAQQQAWSSALAQLRGPAGEATSARGALTGAQGELDKAGKVLEAAQARRTVAEEKRASAARAVEVANDARASADSALEAQASGERVEPILSELEQEGAAVREGREALTRGRADVKVRAERLRDEEASLAEGRDRHEAAAATDVAPRRDALEQVQARLRDLAEDGVEARLRALRDGLEGLQQRREALSAARGAVVERSRRRSELEGRQEAVGTARAGLDAARSAEARAQVAAAEAGQAEGEAARRLEPLARIAALGEERDELEDGTPCPLCGSEDHPFRSDPALRRQAEAIDEEVRRAREALATAEEERKRADGVLREGQVARAAEEARLAGAEEEARGATSALAESEAEADRALEAVRLPATAGLSEVEVASSEAEREREAQRARVEELEEVQRSEQDAMRRLEEAVAAHRAEGQRLEKEAARLQAAREALVAREEGLAADEVTVATRAEALQQALAAVGVVAAEPLEGVGEARRRVVAWRAARDAAREAERVHREAGGALEAAVAAVSEATRAADEASAAVAERRTLVAEAEARASEAQAVLQAAWVACCALDGPEALPRPALTRPPAELVGFQEERVAWASEALEAERQRLREAEQAHAAAVSRQEALTEETERTAASVDKAQGALRDRLVAVGLDGEEALRAVRLDEATLTSARAEREALRAEGARTAATLAAAEAQAQRHEVERPETAGEESSVEGLTAALETLAEERRGVQERHDAARTTVEMAERDQAKLERAQAALDADREAASVWLTLHDLIGKGEGRAFKLFAQALNLDQLLVRANRHLEALNDRYHLVTVREDGLPTLEFEVSDRWRPGTTRSLKTLSGGESFLVSLALALGLSDLRTSSMPVETLLLDEGFGTLDPATLDTALAALQQLQQSGRQVGLISHVVGLEERIEARVRVEPLGEGRSRVRVG